MEGGDEFGEDGGQLRARAAHQRDIAAGAEQLAIAGEDDAADRRIALAADGGVEQRAGERQVDRIADRRTIQRDPGDAVGDRQRHAAARPAHQRGAMRMAPSRRITSPFSIGLRTIDSTSWAYSAGLPRRLG